jgi:hypothetical protein
MKTAPAMILDSMREAADRRRLAMLHFDGDDWSYYLLGFLLNVGSTEYALRAVSLDGHLESIKICRSADVVRVDVGSPRLELLMSRGKEIGLYLAQDREQGEDSVRAALETCRNNGDIVTFCSLSNEEANGQVMSLDSQCVAFRELESGGQYDGDVVLCLDTIRYVEYGGPVQAALKQALHGSG